MSSPLAERVARMRAAGKPIPRAWSSVKTPKPVAADAPPTKRMLTQQIRDVNNRIAAKRVEVAAFLGIPLVQVGPNISTELTVLYQERGAIKRARKAAKKARKENHPKPFKRRGPRLNTTRSVQYTYDESDDARLDEFYQSAEWRLMRYEALRLHGAACQCCGRSPRLHGVVLNVDHIKPLRVFWDLRLELSNLQVLCGDCNVGKGARHDDDWRKETAA